MSASPKLWLGLLLFLVGCTSASLPPVSASRYKFFVSANGLYQVGSADLKKAGADVAQIEPSTLQLFHENQEVAIRVQGERGNFSLDFYGQASDSAFYAQNVYWLTWGVQNGKRMEEATLSSTRGQPKASFEDTATVSEQSMYEPQAVDAGSPWYWQVLSAPVTTTVAMTLPAALPTDAHLRVNLWGSTQAPVSPNHHLVLFFNDRRIGDAKWGGQGAHPIDVTVPGAVVRAGANTVRLVAPGDTGAPADILLLRSMQITFQRQFVAQGNSLAFTGGAGQFKIGGFSDNSIELFDITNPTDLRYVAHPTVSTNAITFSADAGSPRQWLAIDTQALKAVDRIAAMISTDLHSSDQQADYIIITHPTLLSAVAPLVQLRAQHGLKVSVVTTDQIYDEFGYGEESPLAIRQFIDWAYRQWKPPAVRFVLLVGKATYDYRNYLQGPNPNLVPTYLVPTPNLGQAASDDWFVTEDNTGKRPFLALGRIPAKTPDQVTQVVNKIITYESGKSEDWQKRALFIADNKDPQFVQSADSLATKLSPAMTIEKAYLESYSGDVNAARADIVKRWNDGAMLVTYVGHGSIDTWAEGPLLSTQDLGTINNGPRLPILITPTCLDGFFYHPQVDSLTENLLFKSGGGIVAGLVPTGLSYPPAQDQLMSALFGEIFAQSVPTLGEAILRAKQTTTGDSPELLEVMQTFGLLGDPALRLTIK